MKFWECRETNSWQLGAKRKHYLCAMPPSIIIKYSLGWSIRHFWCVDLTSWCSHFRRIPTTASRSTRARWSRTPRSTKRFLSSRLNPEFRSRLRPGSRWTRWSSRSTRSTSSKTFRRKRSSRLSGSKASSSSPTLSRARFESHLSYSCSFTVEHQFWSLIEKKYYYSY